MIYSGLVGQLSGQDLGANAMADAVADEPPGPPTAATDVPLTTEGFGDPGPVRWLTDKMGGSA